LALPTLRVLYGIENGAIREQDNVSGNEIYEKCKIKHMARLKNQ
jgi:hypothetical protein